MRASYRQNGNLILDNISYKYPAIKTGVAIKNCAAWLPIPPKCLSFHKTICWPTDWRRIRSGSDILIDVTCRPIVFNFNWVVDSLDPFELTIVVAEQWLNVTLWTGVIDKFRHFVSKLGLLFGTSLNWTQSADFDIFSPLSPLSSNKRQVKWNNSSIGSRA